jgi:HrpA-like RNA helicase
MLPILAYREKIKESLRTHQALILTAPPGTGKSTQVPRFLLDDAAPGRQIVVLEPRRIAARTLAYRVADEMGCACGETVGYQVRFDRKASDQTRIVFMTY